MLEVVLFQRIRLLSSTIKVFSPAHCLILLVLVLREGKAFQSSVEDDDLRGRAAFH